MQVTIRTKKEGLGIINIQNEIGFLFTPTHWRLSSCCSNIYNIIIDYTCFINFCMCIHSIQYLSCPQFTYNITLYCEVMMNKSSSETIAHPNKLSLGGMNPIRRIFLLIKGPGYSARINQFDANCKYLYICQNL